MCSWQKHNSRRTYWHTAREVLDDSVNECREAYDAGVSAAQTSASYASPSVPREERYDRPALAAELAGLIPFAGSSIFRRSYPEHTRNIGQGRLFCVAHLDTTETHKAAFFRGIGDVLADLTQPTLERHCVAWRLGIKQGRYLLQRLDRFGLDVSGFAPWSEAALASSLALANDSLSMPQSPLGSAAVMAMLVIIGLSRSSFHSSGVKLVLLAIGDAPLSQLAA